MYRWVRERHMIGIRGRNFLEAPWAGGVVLLGCVIVAMLLANLPGTSLYYRHLLETDLSLMVYSPDGLIDWVFPRGMTVEKLINDGLMVIFFFAVGLEIKREIVCGQLSSARQAILPVLAAAGGMLAPAIIFLFFNHGTIAANGWGIPTATDIAFAIGILSMLGDRVPVSLKIFLTALAIADDLGAILVIALFYGGQVQISCLLAAFVICFAIIKPLANAMLQMGLDAGFQYVYLSPSELLTSYFKLALVLAVVVVSPLLIFQIWGFVAPALTKKEKRAIRPALLGGFFFFCLGALFSYMVALPFMIQFLVNFSTSDFIHSAISVASYLDFMIGMLLTFGVVFEEPMLAFVLTKLGILTPDILRKVRRYAIPLIFVIAAVITPPDVVSQFMVAVPMIGLYELSILISCVIYKKKQNEDDDEDEDEDDEEDDEDEEDE